jgi:hypothetical protein
LGTPVGLWMSDKQEAFVTGIAAEFPDVPHRYCDNHFLRDLAKDRQLNNFPNLRADGITVARTIRTSQRTPAHDVQPRDRALHADVP